LLAVFRAGERWGGMKQSGWGGEKGPYGLDLFTQVKSVIVNYP
jgi:acyl-CoA reductase-like NAD-dependent aldehyde dehydrogenase